ncbi:MAG: hypothetical protein IH914_02160 [candidate division Zixibacteria bacterium]|nr:hypothetical protein [candidate division Zixibacteria bacterium]
MVKFTSINKTALLGAAILCVGLSLNSCKDDILLPVPRGIEGEYSGFLFITKNATGGGERITDSMAVRVVFRLGADKTEQEGTYSHILDTTVDATVNTTTLCDITLGTWFIRDQKVFLSPGPTDPGSVCDPTIVPSSFTDPPGGGVTIEIGFGKIKLKQPPDAPDENEIGDSLILRQTRFDVDRETVFRLEVLSIPDE